MYVLGISHVSNKSLEHIEAVVKGLDPEVIAVELCKDRSGSLGDPDYSVSLFHCSDISLQHPHGGKPGYPTDEQLLAPLTCKPGYPITRDEIRRDEDILLSTGRVEVGILRGGYIFVRWY